MTLLTAGQVAALVGLGLFHGVNPGMGWLFAVSIGLQARSRWALLAALPPIAAGHAAAVAVAAVLITVLGSVAAKVVVVGGGALLLGFGLWRVLSRRHLRWAGMKLSRWQLARWSFVMSSAHGAGFMLLPVLAREPASGLGAALDAAVAAAVVHGLAMTAAAGAVAVLVFEVVGLGVLRRAWVDVDRVWAFTLVGAGAVTVLGA